MFFVIGVSLLIFYNINTQINKENSRKNLQKLYKISGAQKVAAIIAGLNFVSRS